MEQNTPQPSSIQSTHTPHHSRIVLLVSSAILIILAAVLIMFRIRAKREYDAYLKTPEGQMDRLRQTSRPVTKTSQERATDMEQLSTTSAPVQATHQQQIDTLTTLSNQ